jgi:hypothetical protein
MLCVELRRRLAYCAILEDEGAELSHDLDFLQVAAYLVHGGTQSLFASAMYPHANGHKSTYPAD